MADGPATKVIKKKIEELNREKGLIQSRLNTLSREYNPDSNSRENSRREQQINDCQLRIQKINDTLKDKRQELSKIEKAEIEDFAYNFSNLSFESKQESNTANMAHAQNNANMENLASSDDKTPTSNSAPTAATSDPQNIQTENTNTKTTAGTFNFNFPNPTSNAASTPKIDPTSTTHSGTKPKTSASFKTQSDYNLPKTHESVDERTTRLGQEKREKDEWEQFVRKQADLEKAQMWRDQKEQFELAQNMKFFMGEHTGNSFKPKINTSNFDIKVGTPLTQIPQQHVNIPHNEDVFVNETWRESPKHFVNYKPTPQRITSKQLHERALENYPFEMSQHDHSEHNYPTTSRNRVTFENHPTNIPQRNIEPQQSFNMAHSHSQPTARNTFLKRLKLIPTFSGDSHKELRDFIEISETLYCSCMNEVEEQEFFEQMILQLRGEPLTIAKNIQNFDWETIKSTLLRHFSYLSNREIIQSQLENLHQEKDESLSQFTERVRRLLVERNSIYTNLTEEQRAEHNRLARRSFAKGIKDNDLRRKMMNRGASSLEDAIAFALEAENDALSEIPRSETFCRVCRMNGHRESQCRRKNGDKSEIDKLITALRSVNARPPTNRNPNFSMNRNNGRNWSNRNPNWVNRYPNNGFNNYNTNGNNGYNGNGNNNGNNNSNPNPNWQSQQPNRNFNNGFGNRNMNTNNQQYNQNRGYQNNNRPRTNNFVRNARTNQVHNVTCNDQHLGNEPEN